MRTARIVGATAVALAVAAPTLTTLDERLTAAENRLDNHEKRIAALEPTPLPTVVPTPSATPTVPVTNGVPVTNIERLSTAAGKTALLDGTYEFSNFDVPYGSSPYFTGVNVPNTVRGMVGKSPATTVLRMRPNTSTKAGLVQSGSGAFPGANGVNTLYLMTHMAMPTDFRMENLTVQGTAQGHLYNGVKFDRPTNLTVRNVAVNAVPGNSGSPPGETFHVSVYKSQPGGTLRFERVTMDGAGVGAGGLATNNTAGRVEINDTDLKNMRYSAGIPLWQIGPTSVVNIRNSRMSGNRRNLGVECHSGVVNVYDPVWGDPASTKHDVNLTYGTSSGKTWKNGKVNFYFTDRAAWERFIANRANKKIKVVTNPYQSYGNPLMPAGSFQDLWNNVNVYVGGVKQRTTDYVAFTGRRS